MVGVALATGLVILLAWMYKNHHTDSKIATNLVHSIQDIKNESAEVYDKVIKPKLTEYNTKYVTDVKGNITTIPDKSVISAIDDKLKESNRL